MNRWDVELANIIKERNNPKPSGMIVGKVISGLPDLQISFGDEIILDTDQLVVANRLYSLQAPLADGDMVIVMPDPQGQIYFVLDKVGE